VKKREKQAGLLVATIVVAGLALSGVAIVRDGPQGLGLGRPEPLPVAGAVGDKPDSSNARGQPIEVPEHGLTPEQRRGSEWTTVPGTPRVVPQVRYADGTPVPPEDVPKVLGYDGEKVRRRPPQDAGEAPMTPLHRPISADEFWAGLGDASGSPADVAPIPGR
jgi:hypothetical protein